MTTTEDGLYLMSRNGVIHEFYLSSEDALEEKEELEDNYPPDELNLTVYRVANLEEIG